MVPFVIWGPKCGAEHTMILRPDTAPRDLQICFGSPAVHDPTAALHASVRRHRSQFGRSDRCAPGRCARRSDQRPEEEKSPRLRNSAAHHRFCEFGRKSLYPRLTTIVVKATIPSCSTSKSSMIRRPRRWPWSPCGAVSFPSWPCPLRRQRWPRGLDWLGRRSTTTCTRHGGAAGLVCGWPKERKWGGLTERLLVATRRFLRCLAKRLGPGRR